MKSKITLSTETHGDHSTITQCFIGHQHFKVINRFDLITNFAYDSTQNQ